MAANRRSTGLTRGLGAFSLGLGTAQLLAPSRLNELIGLAPDERHDQVMRRVGIQEVLVGVALLSGRLTAPTLWSRVTGDALHLGMLNAALRDDRNDPRRLTATISNIAGVAVLDLFAAVRATRRATQDHDLRASATVTVRRDPQDVYRFWRDLQHLPEVMTHLRSVEPGDDGRSHWVVDAPGRRTVSWDAELVEDRPGELLSWRSLPDAKVPNAGTVRFAPAPGDRGTELAVELEFSPPAGRLGAGVARALGEHPDQQLRDDLRRCKQVLEVGEVVRSQGSPDGMRSQQMVMQRPGQPID